MAEVVRKLKINRRYASSACAWCGDALALGDGGAVCEACETPHHARCWDENDGCGDSKCISAPFPKTLKPHSNSAKLFLYMRLLSSSIFYLPISGLLGGLTTWLILEPWIDDTGEGNVASLLLFPLTATLIVLFIFVGDGIASRRLRGNVARWLRGTGLTLLLSSLAIIPVELFFLISISLLPNAPKEGETINIQTLSGSFFIGFIIARSVSWALYGAALGLGMNLMRSTSAQRRASVMGGVVGGAISGILMDSVNRFLLSDLEEGSLIRLMPLCTMGLCIGFFVALGERLSREAWVRVRTGPLAGQLFVLYRNATTLGSSLRANIFLTKDVGIAPTHAAIYRVGEKFEIESLDSKRVTVVNGKTVRRHRLSAGDHIVVGDTTLDFEERAKQPIIRNVSISEN